MMRRNIADDIQGIVLNESGMCHTLLHLARLLINYTSWLHLTAGAKKPTEELSASGNS